MAQPEDGGNASRGGSSAASHIVTAVVAALVAGLLTLVGWLLAGAGLAQSPGYPDRPVKIIVPFAAAGPTDDPDPTRHLVGWIAAGVVAADAAATASRGT